LVCLGPVVLITVAALFLLALALVIANKTLFLAAVLFIIPVFLPIATPILASVISHDHVIIDDGQSDIIDVIARENGEAQESSKDYCQYSSNHSGLLLLECIDLAGTMILWFIDYKSAPDPARSKHSLFGQVIGN
jgi:hypothetical protein